MDIDDLNPSVRQYMSALGKKKTPKKLEALAKNRLRLSDPDVKAKMRAAQQKRRAEQREREAQEIAEGKREPPQPKRPVGRPKKGKEKGEYG